MAECDEVTRKGELRLKVDQSTEKGETLANLKLKSRNHNKILEETRDIQTSMKVKRIIERPFFLITNVFFFFFFGKEEMLIY